MYFFFLSIEWIKSLLFQSYFWCMWEKKSVGLEKNSSVDYLYVKAKKHIDVSLATVV